MLVNLPDEAIASAGNGFYVLGLIGRVTERLPQPAHGGMQGVLKINVNVRPDCLLDFIGCDQFARLRQQHAEDAKGFSLKLDLDSVLAKLCPAQVKFENVETGEL